MSGGDEFLKKATALAERNAPFEPFCSHDRDGDCIETFYSNRPFKARWIDAWVTVYLDNETDEIIGSLISHVHALLALYPGIDIDIHDGRVRLSHILRASAWQSGDEVKKQEYEEMIHKAEELGLETELQPA